MCEFESHRDYQFIVMTFFDERESTIFALIARSPKVNGYLLNSLTGYANDVAAAILNIKSAKNESTKNIATGILKWAKK
jgi:hypothetical protein